MSLRIKAVFIIMAVILFVIVIGFTVNILLASSGFVFGIDLLFSALIFLAAGLAASVFASSYAVLPYKKNETMAAAYFRDLQQQKQMTMEIEQRDRLLDTVNSAAAILLKSLIDEFEKDLHLCMGMIARAMDIDKVYIWKNHIKNGKLYHTQIYKWLENGEKQMFNSGSVNILYTERLPGWEAALSKGNCISSIVREMSAEEQEHLSPNGVKSIFVMPVFLRDEFWGFIKYDDCRSERVFTKNEQSIMSSAGNVIAYAIFQNEMTRSIRTTALKREAVINNYSGIIWVIDRNLTITLFQGRYIDKLGYTSSSVVGLTLDQFLTKNMSKAHKKIIFENILKTFTGGQQEWITSDADKRLRFHSEPIYDDYGNVTDVVGSIDDITEITRLETELEDALTETREANNAKSYFLARMSHEMRTPLNVIIGLSGMSLETSGASGEIYANLEKVHDAGELLLSTVNDILDISKIEAGKLEMIPSEYNTPSLINDTVTQNILRIGEKPIKFILDIDASMPVNLYGDELRIKQLFNNLLSNAFKYTKEGKVELSVKCESESEDRTVWMIVKVKDTGIGIRSEEMGNLFTDYSQMDMSTNHKIEGTGLGLSITKKIAEMMGGNVTVASEYGRGSVFTARIKQILVDDSVIGEEVVNNLKSFRYTSNKRRKNLQFTRNNLSYARVLVVDDVETNLDVARGMLNLYGLQIDCVTSGQQAVDIIKEEKVIYDAVFMDHMMPEMDGIEAVRIIREEIKSEYAANLPIIALTANAIAGNAEMFMENGFQDFISKPIDLMQLDSVLNTWIEKREVTGEAEIKTEIKNNRESLLSGIEIEGVDLKEGVNRYLSEEAYLDIIRSFCLHTPVILEKIRTFDTADGIPLLEYLTAVHGLKGSCTNISANAAGREAEKLENAARNGDYRTAAKGNPAFIKTAESLVLELEKLLEKITASKNKPEKDSPDPIVLNQLLDAAKEYKASTMEQAIKELESFEYESGGDLVIWLRDQMDDLDYDAIRYRLEKSA